MDIAAWAVLAFVTLTNQSIITATMLYQIMLYQMRYIKR